MSGFRTGCATPLPSSWSAWQTVFWMPGLSRRFLRRSLELERSPPDLGHTVGADCVRPGSACACGGFRSTFNFSLPLSPQPSPGRTQCRPYGTPSVRGGMSVFWSGPDRATTHPKFPPGLGHTVGADCVRPGSACACGGFRSTFNFSLPLSPQPSPGRTQCRPYGTPSVRGGMSVFWSGPDRATTHPKFPPGLGHTVGADCVRPGSACACGGFRSTFNFSLPLSPQPSPGRTQCRPYGTPSVRGGMSVFWSGPDRATTHPKSPPGLGHTVGADCVRPDAKEGMDAQEAPPSGLPLSPSGSSLFAMLHESAPKAFPASPGAIMHHKSH